MRDEQIKELISAYLDGELSVEERAQAERHLADSVECQQFLDQLRRQRVALRSIPRHKLKVDLSERVLLAIEQARPAAHSGASSTTVSPRGQTAKRAWTWQGIAMAVGTVAALFLVAAYLTSVDRNPNHANLVGPTLVPDVPKLPDEVKLPEEFGPEESLPADAQLALNQFQMLVQYIVIYDISVTPQARKNKVFDGWMVKAGIPIQSGIAIDQKLAKEILAARFVGDKKIAAGAKPQAGMQDIEMLFVRGTIKQIDAVHRQYLAIRHLPNPDVRIRLDMAAAPRELHIFLQLNKASGLDLAQMMANPRLLGTPGAFPIQFQDRLRSTSLPRVDSDGFLAGSVISDSTVSNSRDAAVARPGQIAAAGSQLALADTSFAIAQNALTEQAQPEEVPPTENPNDSGQAGQALFIIRNLSDDSNANK